MKRRIPFFGPDLRLIVTCCNVNGGVFLVELRGRDARVEKVLDVNSTGLAVDRDRGVLYIGFPDGVHARDRQLQPAYTFGHKLPDADVHDVKVCPEGLAVVETGTNRLAMYARPDELVWDWSPCEGTGDLSHVNSALLRDGKWFTSMFSAEGLGEPWRERLDGVVMVVPASREIGGDIVLRGLQQPHSLLDVEGEIWFCESRSKRVMRIGEQGPALVAELPSYARGLAVTKKFIIVGQSRSDSHLVRALEGETNPRDGGMCGVWFIPRAGAKRFFVELPAQEVYDIAIFPW